MKYRLPENCCALSLGGRQIAIAADGTVDLDAAAVAALEPHGIVPAGSAAPKGMAAGAAPAGKRPDR